MSFPIRRHDLVKTATAHRVDPRNPPGMYDRIPDAERGAIHIAVLIHGIRSIHAQRRALGVKKSNRPKNIRFVIKEPAGCYGSLNHPGAPENRIHVRFLAVERANLRLCPPPVRSSVDSHPKKLAMRFWPKYFQLLCRAGAMASSTAQG
jgi:hypothetical protein